MDTDCSLLLWLEDMRPPLGIYMVVNGQTGTITEHQQPSETVRRSRNPGRSDEVKLLLISALFLQAWNCGSIVFTPFRQDTHEQVMWWSLNSPVGAPICSNQKQQLQLFNSVVWFRHTILSYKARIIRDNIGKDSVLTLHGGACGLCKERDEQEVDEVDKGQAIEPEQTGCRGWEHNTRTTC